MAFLDRNVVIRIEQLKSELQMEDDTATATWMYRRVGLDAEVVSPILFALEGRNRKVPSDLEMRAEINRAEKALQLTLPTAKVQRVDAAGRKALRRMLVDSEVARQGRIRFLMEVVPLIANAQKPEARMPLVETMLALGARCGISPVSFLMLAVLSCLFDGDAGLPGGTIYRPGRAILKPKASYGLEEAYNAITDIFFLELLANVYALPGSPDAVLYTTDKGLAAFWSALIPTNIKGEVTSATLRRATLDLELSAHLLPTLDEKGRLSLRRKLQA